MKVRRRTQRLLALALAAALLASLTLVGASGLAVVEQEMLQNGDFEGGFTFVPGCGAVGSGWGCFNNGGSATYGFFDDAWARAVASGGHSQLISINTVGQGGSEGNRYAGIFQTVHLVKGNVYQFKVKGQMREREPWPNDEVYRYRVQFGYNADGSTDWTKVGNWVELPWDKIDDKLNPTGFESFATSFTAPSDKITVFLRLWKKWGTTQKEVIVNLDSITMWGAAVKQTVVVPSKSGGVVVVPGKTDGGVVVVPGKTDGGVVVVPGKPSGGVVVVGGTCTGGNLLANGDFEAGFAANGVANKWTGFNNGGAANYGYYDEQWTSVIKDGAHGQLLEINTYNMGAADGDRYAGIYQVVSGLTSGANYQFSLWGLLREEAAHMDEDRYRYRVQWGFVAADADPSQADITNWAELPWDDITVRTAPGPMSFFSTQFKAPGAKVVVGVRAWKKWGTVGRELDVNLDAVKVQGCTGGSVVVKPGPTPGTNACVWYTVKRGDTVSRIAANYRDTINGIALRNKLKNVNRIYVGQKLLVCDP